MTKGNPATSRVTQKSQKVNNLHVLVYNDALHEYVQVKTSKYFKKKSRQLGQETLGAMKWYHLVLIQLLP